MKPGILIVSGLSLLMGGLFAATPLEADHAKRMKEGLKLFTDSVRPAFEAQCLRCHGGEKVRSGFDLATREALLLGGDSGPSVDLADPAGSYLMALLHHEEEPFMPAKEPQLSAELRKDIERWIGLGAPYDKPLVENPGADRDVFTVTETDREFWSFQPLSDPEPPTVPGKTAIDRFLEAKRQDQGVSANAPADPGTLLRRAHLIVTGLPPTPQELADFESAYAKNPDAAYEALVDELLSRPGYGEKWARHWLDVARFAESHGFEQDYDRKYAYHYRDFVIQALNQDMTYDRFVRWQLAGDEDAPDQPLALMATGFLGAGPFPTQLTEKEFESARYDELDDMVATTGTAFLGLTIGCARCHDHKYDPIPASDYYQMAATFTTTIRSEIDLDLGGPEKTKVQVSSEGFPPTKHHADGRGFPHFYPKTHFLNRGDVNQKTGEASSGYLQVLMREGKGPEFWQEEAPEGWRTSYRRTGLANWITDVEHGAGHLAARVIANRLWYHHFGRGIVGTPSDFGLQGERPTHPQLLDYLAQRLLDYDWKLKPLHREIMLSAAFRQSSDFDSVDAAKDPDNHLLWSFSPRRMEAENLRDSMLFLSGEMNRKPFGPGTLDAGNARRSIYLFIKRSKLVPMMQIFDMPEPLTSQGQRPTTTIAPQALFFMNNPNVRRWSEQFAQRLLTESDGDVAAAVTLGFQHALSRDPSITELRANMAFLNQQIRLYATEEATQPRQLALADFCQTLFSLNEFAYIE